MSRVKNETEGKDMSGARTAGPGRPAECPGHTCRSERLSAVASFVTPGNRLCDVGCDHGWLSLGLLAEGTVPSAIGMDLRRGPLTRAAENAGKVHLQDRFELRLSDGLDAYHAGEADTLVIAGMGGRMMTDILLREPDKTRSFIELVLEPQKEPEKVRGALRKLSFGIRDELMICEQGKFYPVIHALRDAAGVRTGLGARIEDRYGPALIRDGDPVLQEYLEFRERIDRQILDGTEPESCRDKARPGATQQDSAHQGMIEQDRVPPDTIRRRELFRQDLADIETIRRYISC